MAHIVWTRELDTNIEVIDKQHRRIVDYINALDDAIAGGDRARVRQVLDQLVDYTLSHFDYAETVRANMGGAERKPESGWLTRRLSRFFRSR